MEQSQAPRPAYDTAELFREHAARVERLLALLGVRACDVPDATQEVFVVAHRKRDAFEGRASVSTWLYRISVRVAAAERRRARHRRELADEALEDAADGGPDALEELARRARLEQLSEALEQLPEAQRTLLALHDLEGLRMHEVAARLGIPCKTAFSRVYAARRALAQELKRRGHALPLLWPLWPGGAPAAQGVLHGLVPSWRGLRLWSAPAKAACAALGVTLAVSQLSPPRPVAGLPRAPVATLATLPSAASVPPPRAAWTAPRTSAPASAPGPQPTAAEHAARRRPVAAGANPASSPPQPKAAEPPAPDFVVTRMGSEDLRPILPHPFAARVQPAVPPLPRMAARLAPRELTPEIPASFD